MNRRKNAAGKKRSAPFGIFIDKLQKKLRIAASLIKDTKIIISAIAGLILITGGVQSFNRCHTETPEPASEQLENTSAVLPKPEAANQPEHQLTAAPITSPPSRQTPPAPPDITAESAPRGIPLPVVKTADPKAVEIKYGCDGLLLSVEPKDGKCVSIEASRLYGGDPQDLKKLDIYDMEDDLAQVETRTAQFYWLEPGALYLVKGPFQAGDQLKITVSRNRKFEGTVYVEPLGSNEKN